MPSSSLPRRLVRVSAWALVTVALPTLMVAGCKKKPTPVGPSPPPPPTVVIDTANPPGTRTNVDARTSMKTPNTGSGWLVFDDFTPTQATTITRVTWQGVYCAEVLNRAAPSPTAEAFEVGFYRDAGNQPDRNAPLQIAVLPSSAVGETLDFVNTDGRCGTAQPSGIGTYRYTVTLPTAFVAQAGTRYWFSVQARVAYVQQNNPDFIAWGWRNGVAHNNRSVMSSPDGALTEFSTDRAYSLLP